MFSTSIVVFNINFIILNKVLSELINCLSIKQIFIIYNGDNDKDFDYLLSTYKKINKINLFKIKNKGFGNAHNYVIKKFDLQKYHIILNPDVIIKSNNLKLLDNFLSLSKENISLISPKILDVNNNYYPSAKLLPNPLIHFLRRIIPNSKLNKEYELKNYKLDELIDVPAVSGCLMIINSNYLKLIKGFDEIYFLYFEDIDIIRRLGKFGKIYYFPIIEAIHIHQADSNKSFKYLLIHLASLIKYYMKWGWLIDKDRFKINNKFKKKINKYKKIDV